MFVLCLFAGAVSNAAYSSDNAETYDEYNCDSNNISVDRENACSDLETVREAQGATAVSFSVTCNYCVIALGNSALHRWFKGTQRGHKLSPMLKNTL